MAYAALDFLAKQLDRILDHQNRYLNPSDGERRRCSNCSLLRKKLQIQSLHEDVVFLSSFLEGFPREAAVLEARLTIAAKQAKHLLDCSSFNSDDENDSEWKCICQELDKSIEEIASLLEEAMQMKSSSKNQSSTSFFPERLNPVTKETNLGFEDILIEIKGRLHGVPSHLDIIPIVGMGGIGKTTLARYAYQDPSTTHHFDVCAWATVSQNSNAKLVLSNILSSLDPSNKKEYQHMAKESLVLHGHRYLKKRRYLVVMDDMWDTGVWDDVRMAFPDDCNGSRIIVTTRDLHVASYVDSSNKAHKMQLMSADQSWRLLKEKVFGQEICPTELEKIGKHIAEKCKGLPLAIVVIAGVLSKLDQMLASWEKIARNVSEAVNTSDDEQFSKIFSVSFMHLPAHLKPCFLYTACFPEDYMIIVSKLIRLWLAEGFIISDESKDMEELGYEYIEDLAKRSLILIEKERNDGMISALKIHDVIRDLCIRKSRDENFLCIINDLEGSLPQGIESSNCLSMCSNALGCIPNMDSTPIHTILFFTGHGAFDYWKNFRLLKVLDAMTVGLPSFAVEISELIHLRYLALAFDTEDKLLRLEVPESLSKLENLQTLVMRPLRDYIRFCAVLPVTIWRMSQLRNIILLNGFLPDPSTNDSLEALPLQNLHTLWHIENFRCLERILEVLPNLKKLGIYYRGRDPDNKTGWSDLKDVPYDIGEIATLQLIEVDFRNLSLVESAKAIQEEEQQSFGNDIVVSLLKSRSWKRLQSSF